MRMIFYRRKSQVKMEERKYMEVNEWGDICTVRVACCYNGRVKKRIRNVRGRLLWSMEEDNVRWLYGDV